jgi:hypothetical protein
MAMLENERIYIRLEEGKVEGMGQSGTSNDRESTGSKKISEKAVDGTLLVNDIPLFY